jgi:hypothetical protein
LQALYKGYIFAWEGIMKIEDAILYLINNLISTLLAIIAVVAFIGKVKPIGNALKHFIFREIYDADRQHDKRLDNLEMQQLKQIICDRNLPDDDRLNAGEEYLKRGGNGEIKARYEALKRACIEKLERAERGNI